MAEVTVNEFAKVLKVPVERLLVQLDEAGIKVSGAEDKISEDAKLELLSHLRRTHGRTEPNAAPQRITLKRKSQNELRLAGQQGRARTINVEVRSKRTYIKRDVLEEQARKQQEELDAHRRAEESARDEAVRAEQERIDAETRAKQEAEQLAAERLQAEQREQEARQRAEEETQRRAEELEAARRREEEEKRLAEQREKERVERQQRAAAELERARQAAPAKRGKAGGPDHTLHVADGMAGRRRNKKRTDHRRRQVNVESHHGFERPTAPVVREVEIPETITVADLAQRIAIK
jgi:translation initiation factor IF-2